MKYDDQKTQAEQFMETLEKQNRRTKPRSTYGKKVRSLKRRLGRPLKQTMREAAEAGNKTAATWLRNKVNR